MRLFQSEEMPASASILICTCNRSSALRQTLETLRKVRVPAGLKAEVIVVDNASTDDTAAVVRSVTFPNMAARYVYEGKRGKSNALNTGLAMAQSEIILFTDDDVFIPEDWLEQMAACFGNDQCDAVVGKITLAPELQRPWLSERQKLWLACVDFQSNGSTALIGANMGFRRSVLERVPAYDPELGPGALGLGEESLFGSQLVEAGFKIKFAPTAVVVHFPEKSRLKRSQWLDTARKKGRQEAYIQYHWEHADISAPRLKWLWYQIKLHARRIFQPPPPLDSEGCPAWEMSYVTHIEMCKQFLVESRRVRNYSKWGLLKRNLKPAN